MDDYDDNDAAPLIHNNNNSINNNNNNNKYTVEDAIDHIGIGIYQYKLLFIVGFCWMADAMEMLLLSYLTAIAGCVWKLSPVEEASIITSVFIGMAIGASFWGAFGDKFGRKPTYLLTGLFTAFTGVASAVAPTYLWLLFLRGLVGFGIGGLHVAYTLFSEFLPTNNRAVTLLSLVLFWAIGCIFEALVAWFVLPRYGWRWMLAVSAIPMIIVLFFYPFLPESPRYYVIQNEMDKAKKALEIVAKANGTALPSGEFVRDDIKEDSSNNNNNNDDDEAKHKGDLKYLLNDESHLRYTSILLWILWFLASFVYYGMILSTTEILSDDMIGKRCHRALSAKGHKGHHKPNCNKDLFTNDDYMDVFFTSVAEIPGIGIAALLLHSVGRKPEMYIMFGASSICLLLLLFCTSRSFETILMGTGRALMLGGWQGLYVYTPEIYPTFIRATGMGIASAMARFAGMTTPMVAQVMSKKNVNYVFWIYGLSAAFAAFLVTQLGVETKGRKMPDTHEEVCSIPHSSCSVCTARLKKRKNNFEKDV